MLDIPSDILRAIEAHAQQTYPEECCGILLGVINGRSIQITYALPAANVAEPADRNRRYLIDPRALLHAGRTARDRGCEILGGYHSHPDHPPLPSQTDSQQSWEGYIYIIVSISTGAVPQARAWRFRNESPIELLIHITP